MEIVNLDSKHIVIERECKKCGAIRTKKQDRHCSYCGICIKYYDHHCPWVSKCIGKKNIHFFNFFVGNYIKTCRIYPNIYNVLSNSALLMPQVKLIIFSTSHIIYDRR